ncbi:TrmH family RNA methyltransferase [Bifidobacterium longum]|uniref:TrmH family RNA methyltransferase n=1 Tax=Bifidobacterium longum TaxID=216816 RepID=UPI003243F04E
MQFITLDTVDDPRVEAYVSLTEMQLRNRLEPAKGVFIAESPKVIDRALAADREPLSLLVEEPWLEGMKDTFDFIDGRWGTDIPVYVASPEQLKRLTGYRLHRGALCAMRRWPLPSVAEVCRSARRVAVMENIVDHTNVGALMRSAAALDVDAVLATPSCGDPLYRRAARVSMGTVFQIPWTRITGFNDDGTENKHYWPFQGIDELKSLGFTTVAMALEDRSISLDELTRRLHAPAEDPTHIDKLAMIFGTEGDGLSHHTIARADLTVKIPMSHGVDSLNVAASSAVAFYATR